MEMQQQRGIRVGNGKSIMSFGAAELQDLARCIGEDLDDLRPMEDKPSYVLMYLGAKLREFFRQSGHRTEVTLHSTAVSVYKASNFVVEIVSGDLCAYVVFPGTVDGVLRQMQAQVALERKNSDPAYKFYMLAFLRMPMGEPFTPPATVNLIPCGDYVVGEGDPDKATHRLFVAGARIEFDDFGAPLKGLQ